MNINVNSGALCRGQGLQDSPGTMTGTVASHKSKRHDRSDLKKQTKQKKNNPKYVFADLERFPKRMNRLVFTDSCN